MTAPNFFRAWLSEPECHAWGGRFASTWDAVVAGMAAKATAVGRTQQAREHSLEWLSDTEPVAIYFFLDDPTDLAAVRRIFNDHRLPRLPIALIVARQSHEHDPRGDTVFDIFRLSAASHLTHENRVFTPPRRGAG